MFLCKGIFIFGKWNRKSTETGTKINVSHCRAGINARSLHQLCELDTVSLIPYNQGSNIWNPAGCEQCDFDTRLPHATCSSTKIKPSCAPRAELEVSLSLPEILRKRKYSRTAAGPRVRLQSSELTLVTCDRLSHQTRPYDIKKTHTAENIWCS